jgi:hypothetical protein
MIRMLHSIAGRLRVGKAGSPGRSVADLARKQVLKPQAKGPVASWDGEARRTSIAHDSVHDEV